jgi:hypothetical protein
MMTIQELAVLYALNSLAVIGDELGEMEGTYVPASTVTKYIRSGMKTPGQTWPGLIGPLRGLDPKWKPTKRQVVAILGALRGCSNDVMKRRHAAAPMVSVIERPGKGNLYRLSSSGVSALCL